MLASAFFSDLPAEPREAAAKLLGDLMLSQQTINLYSLVQRFSDCDLLEVEIEGDGYCLPAGMLSPKTLIVIPPKSRGDERRRFTLAHELGHLACHYNSSEKSVGDEENWCDMFASELLMPKARVEGFARTVVRPGDWLKFTQHFKVSRAAAARKLWEYCRVVMITETLNLRIGDSRYDAVRRELVAHAMAIKMRGDSALKLSDGTPCLIRRQHQGYVAVAKA